VKSNYRNHTTNNPILGFVQKSKNPKIGICQKTKILSLEAPRNQKPKTSESWSLASLGYPCYVEISIYHGYPWYIEISI